MKNYFLTTVMLGCIFLSVNAQAKKNKFSGAAVFSSIVQAGILEGSADKTYGQLQLINGIQKNKWFYGLGLGIDYYGEKRSVPIFVDIRRDLLAGKNTFFMYADGGYNVSWLRNSEKIFLMETSYKAIGGLFYEAGIGYKIILKNKVALGLSAGYSFKEQKEYFTIRRFNQLLPGRFIETPEIYKYEFRRISFKINCSF
ncbi:MAG: hypothetical protein ABIN01_00885 [Ferruginibacter sp.]